MRGENRPFESCVISARSKANYARDLIYYWFESCVISAGFKALLCIHAKRSDEND